MNTSTLLSQGIGRLVLLEQKQKEVTDELREVLLILRDAKLIEVEKDKDKPKAGVYRIK